MEVSITQNVPDTLLTALSWATYHTGHTSSTATGHGPPLALFQQLSARLTVLRSGTVGIILIIPYVKVIDCLRGCTFITLDEGGGGGSAIF